VPNNISILTNPLSYYYMKQIKNHPPGN